MIKILELTSDVLVIKHKPSLLSLIIIVIVLTLIVSIFYLYRSNIAETIALFLHSSVMVGFWVLLLSSQTTIWTVERDKNLLTIRKKFHSSKTYSLSQIQLIHIISDRYDLDESWCEIQLASPQKSVKIDLGVGIWTRKDQKILVESISSFLGICKS